MLTSEGNLGQLPGMESSLPNKSQTEYNPIGIESTVKIHAAMTYFRNLSALGVQSHQKPLIRWRGCHHHRCIHSKHSRNSIK